MDLQEFRLGGGKQKEEEDDGYLHQNKEGCEEEQRGPLHPVQDDLKVLHVGQNQKPESTEDGDPTWRQRGGKSLILLKALAEVIKKIIKQAFDSEPWLQQQDSSRRASRRRCAIIQDDLIKQVSATNCPGQGL